MPPKSTPELRAFRQRLMRWFRRKGRDLPWRRTRDPYRVLVSEFMLQQTQVARVREYYPRFLARYPTIHALARATPAGVHAVWQGLGYYRRAANLHRLARTVVADFDGVLPEDPVALRRLPGVGRYTAGAVATFAFEQAHPAVDTNVGRVIRRAFFGGERQPGKRGSGETGKRRSGETGKRGSGETGKRRSGEAGNRAGRAEEERRVWELAQLLVPRAGNPAWTFNQAIMELGALVCTARVAKCGECPVRGVCRTGKWRNGETGRR
ncbi:MAG: hypothetical protein SF070_18085 [Gemmatimonadota bacterium]|nr:hypothetical protein [Gemmatimonadota bacterium]